MEVINLLYHNLPRWFISHIYEIVLLVIRKIMFELVFQIRARILVSFSFVSKQAQYYADVRICKYIPKLLHYYRRTHREWKYSTKEILLPRCKNVARQWSICTKYVHYDALQKYTALDTENSAFTFISRKRFARLSLMFFANFFTQILLNRLNSKTSFFSTNEYNCKHSRFSPYQMFYLLAQFYHEMKIYKTYFKRNYFISFIFSKI